MDKPVSRRLDAFLTSGVAPKIVPAGASREWMDASVQRFAYRCLPLAVANSHGWFVLSPTKITAVWDGGKGLDAIKVTHDEEVSLGALSHFGEGVLTFHVGCLFRTEPGISLWVSGPPNMPKRGVYPLTGLVETDWTSATFTMNWKFLEPKTVVFEKDEPICFFFPVSTDIVENAHPRFLDIRGSEEEAPFAAWAVSRLSFNADLKKPGSQAVQQKWQRDYIRGPGGGAHRTKVRVRPFDAEKKK